ncbi:MAG: hypothetical protein HY002_19820 [Candidatus Rokubacteria bacterium]|nr:hypothetical protein [Candidatus Rokubacteria bacterium]
MSTWWAVGLWAGLLLLTPGPGPAAAGPPDIAPADAAGSLIAQRLPRRPVEEPKPAEPAPETKPEPPAAPAPGAPPPIPSAPGGPLLRSPVEPPLGFAGPSGVPHVSQTTSDFLPLPDRWRVGFPRWDRYGWPFDVPYVEGRWWNPYRQNVLKGDYPILGEDLFFSLTAISDSLIEARKLPTPSGVPAARPISSPFFGQGEQVFANQNFILTLELFRGLTAFRPRDWEIRVTPVLQLNYLDTRETGIVDVDPRQSTSRFDSFLGLQEALVEIHLLDLSPNYDFLTSRFGIQPFLSDFRGFLFADNEPGARLLGNYFSNRLQYNLAYFYMLEKDTNSGLNSLRDRGQNVVIANAYYQDFIWPGYTAQLSFHYNNDQKSTHFDDNGFIVRPAAIGAVREHEIDAYYLGWAGDGHVGRLNVSHAFYQVLGRDSLNPIAERGTDINAQMVAIEASVDVDWLRPRVAFFWASGDGNPRDGRARGFDTVFDNPNFAGGPFSFWVRQGIGLTGARVNLVNRNSIVPSLRSSKEEGQANFVNPGLLLFNVGLDAFVTPKLRASLNLNYLRFQETAPLEVLLFQSNIDKEIGWDASIGLQYRPLLIDNLIVTAGFAGFVPGKGFRDIYDKSTLLFSAFATLTVTY